MIKNIVISILTLFLAILGVYTWWQGYDPTPTVPEGVETIVKPVIKERVVTTTVTQTQDGHTVTTTVEKVPVLLEPLQRINRVSSSIRVKPDDLKGERKYEFRYERRVYGPIWAGIGADTSGFGTAVLGIEF